METEWFFLLSILLLIVSVLSIFKKSKYGNLKLHQDGSSLRSIPKVSWSLPIIGHLLQTTLYPESFIDACYTKYGPVFQINMLSKRMAFICDRNLIKEVWKKKEMAAINLFETLDFGQNAQLLHNHITNLAREFLLERTPTPKLYAEYAEKLVAKLEPLAVQESEKKSSLKPVNVEQVFVRHSFELVCHVFFGLDVTQCPQLFQSFEQYATLTEVSLGAGFILPKWLSQIVFHRGLKNSLKNVVQVMEQHLESGCDDSVFSKGYPQEDWEGRSLTVEHLSVGFLKLNVAIVISFSGALLQTLTLLHQHPANFKMAREEATRLMAAKNYKGMIDSPILTSVCMEACRLKTNFMGATCRIVNENCQELGEYSLDGVDLLILGGNVSTAGASAGDVFKCPKSYQPSRWLDNGSVLNRPSNLTTFGGGKHFCLGKQGTIAAINVMVAHFLTKFEFNMQQTTISEVPTVFGGVRPIKLKTCIRKIASV